MKIRVLHSDNARYELIRRAVTDKDKLADVSGGIFAIDALPALINGATPEMLIIDDATSACLAGVESLSLRSPGVETLLISGDATAEFLMLAMRAGVREVVPMSASSEVLQAALTRISHKRSGQGAPAAHEGKVFAFLSCKGGSGATFLAANFAYVLASEFGQRVALIDQNLQFGDAAIFVSESHPSTNLAELAQQIDRLDASLLAASMFEPSPNLFVLAAPEDPAYASDVKREHIEAIVSLARLHYDFVILDVSRSLDAVSLQALDMADTIFPVLQLTLPYVRDGKRLLSIFRSLEYPRSKIRLVVNRHEKGGELSLQDLERAVDAKVSHVVPNSYLAAAASVNLGVPIVKANRGNPISKFLIEMAREFVPAKNTLESGGWWSRMLSHQSNNRSAIATNGIDRG